MALLLIDMINDLNFPEGGRLLRRALPLAERLADFAARGPRRGVLRRSRTTVRQAS